MFYLSGGVSFMEADDEISIRDLEVGRHSVIRPAHTFFGLIQLSGLQPWNENLAK